MNAPRLIAAPIALLALACCGCVPSEPIAPGQFDDLWYLSANPYPDSEPRALSLGERKLPARWVLKYEPSLIWSTVSIVRAVDRLERPGLDEVTLRISDEHARMVAQTLREIRAALREVGDLLNPETPAPPEQWASATVEALGQVERIVRRTTPPDDGADQQPGLSGGPFLDMVVGYLNERSGGALLGDLGPEDVSRVRSVLTQVILRLAFAAAGKQQPENLRGDLAEVMADAAGPAQWEQRVTERLLAARREAPDAPADSQLRQALSATFAVAPRVIDMLVGFIEQWDRMDTVTIDFRRRRGETLVGFTMATQPGREVRMRKMVPFQPILALEGKGRVVFGPKLESTGAYAILFEPIDGGVKLKFEGLIYPLIRLFAAPIESGTVREVRVARASPPEGRGMLSVALLMETDDPDDPRRLISYLQETPKRLERSAFAVEVVEGEPRRVFNYITPERRYTWQSDAEGK